MSRIAVIGNAGGGKSTLARAIASARGLPYFELDKLLWRPGWQLAPADAYNAEHKRILAQDNWVIDGLGRQESFAARVARATEIVLIDMPLWMHFWLAAERQIAWSKGPIENAPAGLELMPPTKGLFWTIWETDRLWMPQIRELCAEAERSGRKLTRIARVEELNIVTRDYQR